MTDQNKKTIIQQDYYYELIGKVNEAISKMHDLAIKSTTVMTAHEERLENVENKTEQISANNEKRINDINDRLTSLEKWKWALVGGLTLLGATIGYLSAIAKLL